MRTLVSVVFLLFSASFASFSLCFAQADDRPNILLLVADDLGYADLGSYGGDIDTPNIDALAERGLRFTQFHTAPTCAPTRAMLLSGNDNHVAGMGLQGERMDVPGYEGHLSDRIVPFPLLLQDAGYHTYAVGKWHLGKEEIDSPAAKGFERSFNLLQGAGNHYNDIGLLAADSVSLYREDGRLVDWPEGRYSTELYTSKLIQFIEDGMDDGRPFFAFAAFTSPHWPLQAPEPFRSKYRGRYDMGYDDLRVQRLASLKRAGVIPEDAELPPRLDFLRPWSDLSDEERQVESRKMELYAAMLDNLDFHVGRILDSLQTKGLLENTLIVFMSDNGAAANDFYVTEPFQSFLQPRYDNSYENMGLPTSFVSYGPQWAHAGAAPFNRYKGFGTEGGTAVPIIVTGPMVPFRGEITGAYATVMDLAPTILEIAGATYPGSHGSSSTRPLLGQSMLALISRRSDSVHAPDYVVAFEQNGRAFLRRGDWKLVAHDLRQGEDAFMLFNVAKDLGETTDLSSISPTKYLEMKTLWSQYWKDSKLPILASP